MQESQTPKYYIRYPDLRDKGIVKNRVTLSRWIKAGRFPKPIHLGPNSIAWLVEEICAWEQKRISERGKV